MSKKKKAASITYFKENLDVPVISSFGEGLTAEKIIRCARENGVTIIKQEDFFAFEELFTLGGQIPGEMYELVASLLAGLLKTNKEYSIKMDECHETK